MQKATESYNYFEVIMFWVQNTLEILSELY